MSIFRADQSAHGARSLALLSLVLGVPFLCSAGTITYSYVGNNFTSVSLPFTTSESITGEMTLPDPLAANLADFMVGGVTTFSWSDGAFTLNSANARTLFMVSTDSAGNITAWNVYSSRTTAGDGADLSTCSSVEIGTRGSCNNLGKPEDFATLNGGYPLGSYANNLSKPGTWTTTVAAPEPFGFVLVPMGLATLAVLRHRGKRSREARGNLE